VKLSASFQTNKLLDWKTFEKPLTGALATTLQTTVKDLQEEIKKSVQNNFYFPGNPDRLTSRWFGRKGKGILSAELSYKFEAVPLSRYPMNQYRITIGSKILHVRRGAGKAANKFTRTIVPKTATVSMVKVRRNSEWKVINGKLGYMGWLHTGRRSGELGYNGQVNTFSAKVFERNQQETWRDNVRQPIHQLFGPSLTQILQTKELQDTINNSVALSKIEQILLRSILI